MWFQQSKRQRVDARVALSRLSSTIDRVLTAFSNNQPVTEIYQVILEAGVNLMQSPANLAFLRIANCATGETKHLVTLEREFAVNVLQGLQGVTGRAMRTGEPQRVSDVRKDPDYVRLAPDDRVRSELAVPIGLSGSCRGVLNFEATSVNWFTVADVDWAMMLAELAALVDGLDEQRRQLDVTTVLGGAATQTALQQQLEKLLRDEVLSLFPPSVGVMAEILGVVPATRQVITLALQPDTSIGLYIRLREGEGTIGRVFQTGQPFVGNLSRSAGDVTHLLSTQSALVMPIKTQDGRIVGLLNIESPLPDTFDQHTMLRLQTQGTIERMARLLAAAPTASITDEMVIEELLHRAEKAVCSINEPEDVVGAYDQVLLIATQLVEGRDVSGGILLLRDEAHNRVTSTAQEPEGWIVVTATLGTYRPQETEWSLTKPSITRRVIKTRQPQRIANVEEDPDYWSAGPGFKSVLNVPLLDKGNPIGTIDLVSPNINAFSEPDERRVVRLATYVVQAVKRADDIVAAQRADTQLRCAREIHELLAPLFSSARADVAEVRMRVVSRILEWALQHTDSVIGIVALAEQVEDHEPELVLTDYAGSLLPTAKRRWLTTEGITGRAYTTGQTQSEPDVNIRAYYFSSFSEDIQSELASPLKRGDERVGVLDVQSTKLHHYTRAHLHWLEFLADQLAFALTAISLATKREYEAAIADLTSDNRRGIAEMRTLDLKGTALRRDVLRQRVLDTIRERTGAAGARILVAANAYGPDDSLDTENGQLVVVNTSPPLEYLTDEPLLFGITEGIYGRVLQEQRRVVFGHEDDDPSQTLVFSGQPRRVRSRVALPIFAGTRIVGVLDLWSEEPGIFTQDKVLLSEEGARLASDAIVSASLRIEELQSEMLRNLELKLLSSQSPNIEELMAAVLRGVQALTSLERGWGQVTLLRSYPNDPPDVVRVGREYPTRFVGEQSIFDDRQSDGDFEREHPRITYSVFIKAIQSRRPVLIVDTLRQTEEERRGMPWPEARSVLCVPLISPLGNGSPSETMVSGLLSVASPAPGALSDPDKNVLSLLAQTVSSALERLILLTANAAFTQELTHVFKQTIIPLMAGVSDLHQLLDTLREGTHMVAVQQQTQRLMELADHLGDLVSLTRDLLTWFFNLQDESTGPIEEEITPLDVVELIDGMRPSMRALAFAQRKSEVPMLVEWYVPPARSLYIAGGDTRENLIRAALFHYIENGLKYGQGQSISISVENEGNGMWATFVVRSQGPQVPPNDVPLLFERGFRSKSVQGLYPGTGIGLYQVSRIARRLHGRVGYQYDDGMNGFVLRLPVVSAPLR